MKDLYSVIAGHNWKFLFLLLCVTLCTANSLAQIHIGSDTPPAPSAMLEVSATDKGILFPSVALSAVDDSSVIINKKAVDGLLVFNTTENVSRNLYKGLYAWNSVKHLWENIATDKSFNGALLSYYATEETCFVANIQTGQRNDSNSQRIGAGRSVLLTLASGIQIDKENCFDATENKFIVSKDGYYKIVCGAEIYFDIARQTDQVSLYLQLIDPFDPKADKLIHVEVLRGYGLNNGALYEPLTPSIIYNDYLTKGVEISVRASVDSKTTIGWVNRKYLYVNKF